MPIKNLYFYECKWIKAVKRINVRLLFCHWTDKLIDYIIPTNPCESLTGPVGRHEIARFHGEFFFHFRHRWEHAHVAFRVDGIL